MKIKSNSLSIVLSAIILLAMTTAHSGETTRVSVFSKKHQMSQGSFSTAISANGRYVAFGSDPYGIGIGDGACGVFVHDRVGGKTECVSVSSEGVRGNGGGYSNVAISADARYVAFESYADNLVAGDTNGLDYWLGEDIFVHDRVTGKTIRVSVSSSGFQGNYGSIRPTISADGRYVAFQSTADNLVEGLTNPPNIPVPRVFVHDCLTRKTTLIRDSEFIYGPSSISADGRYVAFDTSFAVFVHDRKTGKNERVSVSSFGELANGASDSGVISADGRYVAFSSWATNLVDGNSADSGNIYIHDRVAHKTTRISFNSFVSEFSDGYFPHISADGRYVTFSKAAYYIYEIYIYDRMTGRTSLVSISSSGAPGNRDSDIYSPISADGRYVAFMSAADNLIDGDINGVTDIFVRDRLLDKRHIADLQVTVAAKPVSVIKGKTASYKLKVTNKGPDKADHVSLINIISNGTVIGIKPDQGNCVKAAVSVCRLGILPVRASATITFNIKANAKSLTQQVSVNAVPKDNAPRNNARKFSTRVKY